VEYIQGRTPAWAIQYIPLMEALLAEQTENWAQELGIGWGVSSEESQEFIRLYGYRFAGKISESTIEAMRGLMLASQTEGWSILKLIDEVGALYKGWSWERAEMIARSETIRASNAGAVEAFRQTGVVQKQWYTAKDQRVCEFCNEMHEKMVATNANFASKGDAMTLNVVNPDGSVAQRTLRMDYEDVGAPPLHPNCRCTVLPVVEGL